MTEDQKEKNKVVETVDQKKVNKIVKFVNEFNNDVSEGRTGLTTTTREHMLQYIKEIDYAMHRKFVEVCGDIGYAPSKTILMAISTFIEEEKKKLKVGSDFHDFIEAISKIIEDEI